MNIKTKNRRLGGRLMTAVSAVMLVVTVAACSDSETTEDSSGTSNQNFTGDPLVVAVEAPLSNSPLGEMDAIPASVKAAARAINAAGGIQGHEVKVSACDTQANPNLELSCARKAVSGKAIASVGSFVFGNTAGYESTLNSANIPDLAAYGVAPGSYQSANSFPIDFSPGGLVACSSEPFVKKFGDTVTVTAEAEKALNDEYAVVKQTTAAQGLKAADPVLIGSTTADFSPTIQKLEDDDVDVDVMADGFPAQQGLLTAAAAVGSKIAFCATTPLPGTQLANLGAAADNYYTASTTPPLSDASKYPLLKKYISQMKDAGSGSMVTTNGYSSAGFTAWLGMQVLEQVASKISGSIDAVSLSKALSTATVSLDNVITSIDFSKPTKFGPYARVFNGVVYLQKWDSDSKKFKSTDTKVDAIGGPPAS